MGVAIHPGNNKINNILHGPEAPRHGVPKKDSLKRIPGSRRQKVISYRLFKMVYR